MTEPAEEPAKPLGTWRPMALWTAGILLVLGLAWFIGAVAVPVWQVRSALPSAYEIELLASVEPRGKGSPFAVEGHRLGLVWQYHDSAIRRLGGPEKALRKLRVYLLAPAWLAPDKAHALRFLCYCGDRARPALLDAMQAPDPSVRKAAIMGILVNGCDRHERSNPPAVAYLFPDGDDETRRRATTNLERLLSDGDKEVSSVAAEALKKLRGEEAGK